MIKQQESQSQSVSSEGDQYSQSSVDQGKDDINHRKYNEVGERIKTVSNDGKWTDEQNLKYVLFMDYHSTTFASKQKRKTLRIFKSLSSFLGTRTARQCRCHFQKIMNKFKKIKKIKKYYQKQVGPFQYQQKFEQISLYLRKSSQKAEIVKGKVDQACQTEQIYIKLFDLSNEQIIKLMSNLSEFIRPQHFGIMSYQNRSLRASLFGHFMLGTN